jgi:membrane protein implicated in regulation of membrane protease activity
VGAVPRSVYVRYAWMNAPALVGFVLVLIVVRGWFGLPGWLVWLLIACWIAKELIMFPLFWRSYHSERPSLTGAVVGKRGIAKGRLNPAGYIQVNGELWRAERLGEGPPIESGQCVRIHAIKDFTLYVTTDDSKSTRSGFTSNEPG